MATSQDNRLLRLAPASPYVGDGDDLGCAQFLGAIAAGGLTAVVHESFHGAVEPEALEAAGTVELVRAGSDGGTLEALVRIGDAVALIDFDDGHLWVQVAAGDLSAARAALDELRERLYRPEPSPGSVGFAFWSRGSKGGDVRHRTLDVPRWEDVRGNYTAPVAAGLDRLMGLERPADGRLLLWRGAPGTGKTYALRALASAWRSWCSVHYVLDPHALMGQDPSYLLDLLTWEDRRRSGRWRLAVLEDAGDLIVVDAARNGALNALLNVTDGILAQGTRTLVLVTTNEPIERLHPAVHRPGRCLADIEFGPLTAEEAAAWLKRSGSDARPSAAMTVAELYGLAHGDEAVEPVRAERPMLGFGRVLQL